MQNTPSIYVGRHVAWISLSVFASGLVAGALAGVIGTMAYVESSCDDSGRLSTGDRAFECTALNATRSHWR